VTRAAAPRGDNFLLNAGEICPCEHLSILHNFGPERLGQRVGIEGLDHEVWARRPGPESLGQRAWAREPRPESLDQRA